MNALRYVPAWLAAAGVLMLLAGPFWAVLASDVGQTDENFGLGDGTVHGGWLPGQIVLMVGGTVLCVAAALTAYLSARGDADD